MLETITTQDIATRIDHTLLKPDVTLAAIEQLCEEAQANEFAAVCVPPYLVKHAAGLLDGSPVAVATVIGFPFGYASTAAKVAEVKNAIDNGAQEMDAVINRAAFLSDDLDYVRNDIASVATAAHLQNGIIKIIIEAGSLTKQQIKDVCTICAELHVDFVKTSTGFVGKGASSEVVRLMRRSLPETVKIKASGGIRTRKFALELIKAGADRLGSSNSLALIKE